MSSNTLPEKPEDRISGQPITPARAGEMAPSVMRDDDLAVPRAVGTVSGAVVLFGALALSMNLYGRALILDTAGSLLILLIGMAGLLFHAAFDTDVQFRRLYMTFGLAAVVIGAILAVVPYPKLVGQQLPWAIPLLVLGLLFFLCFQRTEADDAVRLRTQYAIGGAGALFALTGLLMGLFYEPEARPWFLPVGFVLSIAGLLYLGAFVAARGTADDLAYNAALGLAGFGAAAVLVVLARTFLSETGTTYFVSVGFVVTVLALFYVLTGLGLALDWPIFVLTRRELAAFFLSPVAYICLFAFCICAWVVFLMFVSIFDARPGRPPTVLPEPVLANYMIALFPVFVLLFVVPVLTMRLLSEEQRSGTLEVLLTAPVDEPVVVLSKFFAGLITYLILWLPFFLILLAIPAAGGVMFDHRPLSSFFIAQIVTGAMFIAMGLFCSSLTSSQIGSGVLTFVGMLLLLLLFFLAQRTPANTEWGTILKHISFLHTWESALEGRVVLRELLFSASMAVLFLFMTVKVLESRKWR